MTEKVSKLPPLLDKHLILNSSSHENGGVFLDAVQNDSLVPRSNNPMQAYKAILSQPVSYESWPAHASGQTYGNMSLVKKHGGEGHSELTNPWEKKVIPKPKFLEQLENFLQTELRALDCPVKGPSELRLQVYREVFEYLITDFKTYRPLLSGIKNEYELVISELHQKVRELEPLKQMLVTVSERCEQKIMQVQEQERQDLVDLRKENIRLLQRIDSMREKEKDYLAQIDKMSEELAKEYEKYKNECDQRRMLVQDLNEMRYQREQEQSVSGAGGSQADGEVSGEPREKEPEHQEDPIILKIALKKCREANEQLTMKLNETLADYANVVPRRHYELLEKEYEDYKEKMKSKEEENEKFTNELEALNKVYAQVVEQRDAYFLELETLKRSSTPRPRWERCADYIDGGQRRWNELSGGKRSENLVDVLLAEISGADISTFKQQDHFDGLGMGEEVPCYLRHEGQIKNMKLDRVNTTKFVKEFWKNKIAEDAKPKEDPVEEESSENVEEQISVGTHQPMDVFLEKHLKDKFGDQSIEWAYNLNDACQRFSFDNRIKQFYDMLTGRMDEEQHHKFARVCAMLQREMEKVGDGETVINQEQLRGAISKHIPKKPVANVDTLIEAAVKVTGASDPNQISFANLFQDTEEGKQSEWVELLHTQDAKERAEFVEQIENALIEKSGNPGDDDDDDEDKEWEITGKELKEAILHADEKTGSEVLEYCICWAFSVLKSENATYPKATKDVLDKLLNSAMPLL